MIFPLTKLFNVPNAKVLDQLFVYTDADYTKYGLLKHLKITNKELTKSLKSLLDMQFIARYKEDGVWYYILNWSSLGVCALYDYFRVEGATYYTGQPKLLHKKMREIMKSSKQNIKKN